MHFQDALPSKPYSALLVTSYGTILCEQVGQREVAQGDMHMVAAKLGCQNVMIGTGWANSCPGCMDRLRKCDSRLVGGSSLAGKATWALSGCMTT